MGKRVALLAVIGLLVASCGGSSVVNLTDVDSGSEVEVSTGDEVRIELDANATTGYEWVVAEGSELTFLELVDSEYLEPDTGLVGAPGIQVFEFEVAGEGSGILRLEYLRSFEKLPVPERVVEFIILVDGATWPPADVETPPGTSTATAPGD